MQKNPAIISANAILLGGRCQKAEGDFVYFIDPKDKSDPANLANQKVYIMSYKTNI